RERSEHGGSPLPTIPQHSIHAECALAARMRVYRHGIPIFEIEISTARTRSFIPPGVRTLSAIGRTVGSAMPLHFGRQPLACPSRIRGSFGMADISGPVQRQWDFVEHRAVEPGAVTLTPEHRRSNVAGTLPLPIRVAPQLTPLAAAILQELAELPVRDHISIDLERGNIDGITFKLVVPSKDATGALQAKMRGSGRNLDHGMRDGGSKNRRASGLRDLSVQRQLMKHVRQRLYMHQTMLNRDVQQRVESKAIALTTCISQ